MASARPTAIRGRMQSRSARPSMATSRQASSSNTTANTKSSQEMTSKVASSSKLPPSTILEAAAKSSPAAGRPKQNENQPTNIQVVIRCRGRSEREMQENSPIVTNISGSKAKDITIQTAPPTTNLGVTTPAVTTTYDFDRVFGPEADQRLIYDEIASPMLEEVLQGYNCTLFAYGQTGSGKTYTMQGDIVPAPSGNPSFHAGMIPRVLFNLFYNLDSTGADYSVKISYLELYNEELRDLLSRNLTAPAGSTQPMGHYQGNKSAAPDPEGLKIFDDGGKRGIFVQGLEEVPVKNSEHALALLTKGSERRQVASTRSNDRSSRSHTVFTVTVYVKEPGVAGEDMLKTGKFNLVDLAGSEDIGKSGAEDQRAKEAGSINQSLLVLGRVMRDLVAKESYIPYRDSKLTRLLQDSLGGRTKTCIVATISPARSNIEETSNTLRYAYTAKHISNKPQANARMTRNALLKEYVTEIERLKSDVLAAREKNGIFFGEETWKEMTAQQELKQTEFEEAQKQVGIVEAQLRDVREEFEQNIGLLMKRDAELKVTKEKLAETEGTLEKTEGELGIVKVALKEEEVVRKAHQSSELTLDEVAQGLRSTAQESLSNLNGLFDKLDRKSAVFDANTKVVVAQGKTITSAAQQLISSLDGFVGTSIQSVEGIRLASHEFQDRELEALSSHSTHIKGQLQYIQKSLQTIHIQDDVSAKALTAVQKAVKDMQDSLEKSVKAWELELKQKCDVICQNLVISSNEGFAAAESAVKNISSLAANIASEARTHVQSEVETVTRLRDLAHDTALEEVSRLRSQNEQLTHLLETERTNGERAKDELIQRISGLLGEFTAARHRDLQETVQGVQETMDVAEECIDTFANDHANAADDMLGQGAKVLSSLDKLSGDSKRTREGALKTLGSSSKSLQSNIGSLQQSVSSSLASFTTDIGNRAQTFHMAFTDGMERHQRAKRARIETTTSLGTDIQSDYQTLQTALASTSRSIRDLSEKHASDTSSLQHRLETYHTSSKSHLTSVEHATQTLAVQGTKPDVPTGRTPKKRQWSYVDQWELTKPRGQLLDLWRKRSQSRAGREASLPEHVPPPIAGSSRDDGDGEGEGETTTSSKSGNDSPDKMEGENSPVVGSSSSMMPPPPTPLPAPGTRSNTPSSPEVENILMPDSPTPPSLSSQSSTSGTAAKVAPMTTKVVPPPKPITKSIPTRKILHKAPASTGSNTPADRRRSNANLALPRPVRRR